MNSTAKEIAEILLSIKAVAISPTKPFRYTSGLLSPVYSDMRLLMSHPNKRRRVIELWVKEIEKLPGIDIIAGTATGAIPHAAWISDILDKPMVYIRGKAKEHGKQNQVEGVAEAGRKAVIIEDLISTGKSAIESVQALRDKNIDVSNVISIYSYMLPQAKQNLKKANVALTTLTTFPFVVEIATRQGLIKAEEKVLVLDWLSDSEGWADRNNIT